MTQVSDVAPQGLLFLAISLIVIAGNFQIKVKDFKIFHDQFLKI
jgi:hypothetical protein